MASHSSPYTGPMSYALLGQAADAAAPGGGGPGIMTSLFMLAFIVVLFAAIGVVGWLLLKVLVRAAYPPPKGLRKCPHCGKDLPDS